MSLDRYREVTLEAARVAADRALTGARDAARAERASCEAEAERMVSRAREEGLRAASREFATEERLTRRRAREIVLGTRRRLYDLVRREALDELEGLRGSREWDRLMRALEVRAEEQLGGGARCVRAQEAVIAEADGRRVTYSLAALVDDALRRRPAEVENLWA